MAAKPYLVAITGGSGSGKSTLADALEKALGPDICTQIGDDNYYKPRVQQGTDATSWTLEECEARINFDATSSKDMLALRADVSALKQGLPINQPIYDFATHDRVENAFHHIRPTPVTIIEGIHVLSDPDMAHLFDLKIFVDTPDDLRLARRIARDMLERGRSLERVLSQYLGYVRPSHYRFTEPAKYTCDLVIADEGLPAYGGATPTEEAINRMLAPVMDRVRKDLGL